MIDLRKLDDQFFKLKYIDRNRVGTLDLWNEILEKSELLSEAVKVVKDKFGERDTLDALAIAEEMLLDYERAKESNFDACCELIKTIFSNRDVARTVLDGASNGGYSFLLVALAIDTLELTDEEKNFAVDEAMNKYGTSRWQRRKDEFERELRKKKITDVQTLRVDVCDNGEKIEVGVKSFLEYFHDFMGVTSTSQAHGMGAFDIRYAILRNPNWTLDEKRILAKEFWVDEDSYADTLEEWEWAIVNDPANSIENEILIDRTSLYWYSYLDLLEVFKDKGTTDRMYEEIQFCKGMHGIRPTKWEKDKHKIYKIVKKEN